MKSRDRLAFLSLVGMAVVVFWRLALTDLIIGRGDVFFYFYPYRDFASAAARAGRVPLWNPYLFMGAPLLANSQVGFFYPFNLALAWLPVEQMVNASIVLHAGLAAVGAFLWGRNGLGLSRPGAWLTGLCYGLGGYFVAQVEHLNQVQVLAWLPWLLWLYELRITGLTLVIGLQFLAGHMQSVFISLVGLAGYVLFPLAWEVVRSRVAWRSLIRPVVVVVGAASWGAALAAVQLLPTFELTQLSIRSGGLPYKEAVSFSLRPDLVGRALLPGWGAALFPEFVAYVGVVGLGLAGLGVRVSWRGESAVGETEVHGLARRGALFLAALGLFFALGGFNPVYFVLVKAVPGFGLFRAPARWLVLYAIGVAGLVGIGLEGVSAIHRGRGMGRRWWVDLTLVGAGMAGLVLLGQWPGSEALSKPDRSGVDLAPPLEGWTVVGWLAAVGLLGVLFYLHAVRPHSPIPNLLVALILVELLGASLFLPFNRATAPGALTNLRPAVSHLLAEASLATTAPPGRFLSISDIFFDPGDKTEIEIVLGSQLADDALYDYLVATKQKEVLIPNLPLYYRLPAMDGYDGGVLPLRHFVTLERLYMPEEDVAIDGRLRENLNAVPDGRWLSLFNIRFVITDKVGDAWFDGVFYDLQMGASLRAGDEATVGHVPALAATALGVVYQADGLFEGTRLAEVDVTFVDGREITLSLLAERSGGVEGGQEGGRVARLTWGQADTPSAIRVRGTWQTGEVTIRGLSLIDERTGVFQSLVLSDKGRYRLVHSGDVKIYENLDLLPRAFFVPQAIIAPDDEAALTIMRAPDFDPRATVVLDHGSHVPFRSVPKGGVDATDRAATEFLLYEPERVVVSVNAPTEGWLLLNDAWYPGWQATVDGQPVPIERANVLFRAVTVPAGEHRVEWLYRPLSFRLGMTLSAVAVVLLSLGGIGARLFRLRQGLL